MLLSEFLEQEQVELPHLEGKAILHIHCHEKAVLNPNASREVLKKLGLQVIEPQVGCCGMAGSFGLEEGHYDVSMKIGNEHLFPAIESAEPDTYIVAHGFSCRTQIKDGTGREALHFAEMVARAFEADKVTKTEPAEVRAGIRRS